jgi:chromosome segregation ATPase
MPIPTDTYRNIKVLNWLFAASALLLLGVMGLSVLQDYHKSWRDPQINNRVWEAALVDDKLHRMETPEHKQELAFLEESMKAKQKEIDANQAKLDDLKGRVAKIRSDSATLEFGLNNRKAELMVAEAQLEEARTGAATEADRQRVREMEQNIRAPRQRVASDTEQVKAWGVDIEKLTTEMGGLTRDRDLL